MTGKLEYLLALAKSSNTPYKISQCPNESRCDDLKCKLQEVYLMVAMVYHAATDLLRKQKTLDSLQDYIAYWMEICHCSTKMDPCMINKFLAKLPLLTDLKDLIGFPACMINNNLVIILFVKNMYNKEIQRRVVGAKNINTPLDALSQLR